MSIKAKTVQTKPILSFTTLYTNCEDNCFDHVIELISILKIILLRVIFMRKRIFCMWQENRVKALFDHQKGIKNRKGRNRCLID